ncbi:hypothetical protein PSEUBRA_006316 [Kalmanozyma brasiliensis GHG001]|uniref:Uncharacterized protein n=1 Tax=Kalmanozyma brasiliensis (strain GHG001) TaxID=1365824 RepID=V5ERU5_KALBG|nr:uncharacterized protein PSEUBRA_006316 [Kalmanozyma brasiliensis GHG001]EST04569.1 hypothetical protein PSEUBRA_006316 [Kalmanozyma brasiliensis GHG001]
MNEWSTSLGYCAADRFPDSDEEIDPLEAPSEQPAPRADDEEPVNFVETPFTIAARNAQLRKARQSTLPLDTDANATETTLSQHQTTPIEHSGNRADSHDVVPKHQLRAIDSYFRREAPPVPAHGIRRPTSVRKAPSTPPEIIVVSSDSDDVEVLSTKGMDGSMDIRYRSSLHSAITEPRENTSQRALQQFLEEDKDFYESLDREMAQREASAGAPSLSEAASSSARMESMVPDASTSYETSSWAATQAPYAYEGYLVDHCDPLPVSPLVPQAGYMAPRIPIPTHASIMYHPYGNALPYPPIHDAPPPILTGRFPTDNMPPPRPAQSSGEWHQHHLPTYQPPFGPDQHPLVPQYPPTGYERYRTPQYQPYPQPPRPSSASQPSPAPNHSQPSTSRAKLAAYARPKSPRQAQADKARADVVYKALRGASKRTRKSTNRPAPSSSSKGKENEWSTLDASRTERDGSLSLTAALRRPLPATRLSTAVRGGSRLSLPLYRNPGSSLEDRRRAENILSRNSIRNQNPTASTSKSAAAASKAPRLFRPSPLNENEPDGQRR